MWRRRRRQPTTITVKVRNLDGTEDHTRVLHTFDTFMIHNGGDEFLKMYYEKGVWIFEPRQPVNKVSIEDLRLWLAIKEGTK